MYRTVLQLQPGSYSHFEQYIGENTACSIVQCTIFNSSEYIVYYCTANFIKFMQCVDSPRLQKNLFTTPLRREVQNSLSRVVLDHSTFSPVSFGAMQPLPFGDIVSGAKIITEMI